MLFNSTNARWYGYLGGKASAAKRREMRQPTEEEKAQMARLQEEEALKKAKRRELEREEFERFQTAESGEFNGFKFVEVFHENIDKKDALLTSFSDQFAMCEGIKVGRPEVHVYFFTKPECAKKIVRFNRSIYVF